MKADKKNASAVALGKLGGAARAGSMSKPKLRAAAKHAANARWAAVREKSAR